MGKETDIPMVGANAQALGRAVINAAVAAYLAGRDGEGYIEPYILVGVMVPISVAAVIRDQSAKSAYPGAISVEPFCRICGCTDDCGCEGGCYWVEPDLCSACVSRVPVVLDLSPRSVEAAP